MLHNISFESFASLTGLVTCGVQPLNSSVMFIGGKRHGLRFAWFDGPARGARWHGYQIKQQKFVLNVVVQTVGCACMKNPNKHITSTRLGLPAVGRLCLMFLQPQARHCTRQR